MRIALALVAALLCKQDDLKIVVKDGRTTGVFYGWSPIFDLWGNMRRESRTLRPDGLMYYGAPRESLEDFAKRPVTADERKDCGTYEIRGKEFRFTYRDGSSSTGSVEFEADGSLKMFKASGLDLYPVRPGVPFELAGYWKNTTSFNNAAFKMSTTQYKNYSFFKGGIFAHESGVGTICTAVQSKTTERQSGNDILRETVQREVTNFYGDQAKSKMGKFRVQGSALLLDYDDGRKDSIFIGTAFSGKPFSDGTYGLILGGALYDGRPAVYPQPAAGAAPPPPPVVCKTPQFELQVPAGWTLRDQEELHFLVPDDRDADDPFVVVLLGTTLAAKVGDPALAKEFEDVVKGLAKGAKVTSGGETQKLSLDGADAVRIPYQVETDGKPFRVEATCAARGGQALVALAMGSETAMKKSGEKANALLQTAKLAGEAAPRVKIAGAQFEMEMPKDWKSRDAEDGGVKITFLVPPGRDLGNDYAAFLMSTAADGITSAADKAAVADLQSTVKQIAGGLEPEGEPEKLKAGGEPAVSVRCVGKNAAGEVIVVQGYMVVHHGKAVVLMLAGKEKIAAEHAAAVRAGFESLRVKK